MATAKNRSGAAIDRRIAQSTRFELTIADIARRSERRAWSVAWCGHAMAMKITGGDY